MTCKTMEHDYKNPKKLGRANYICRKCWENITLELTYIALALKDK